MQSFLDFNKRIVLGHFQDDEQWRSGVMLKRLVILALKLIYGANAMTIKKYFSYSPFDGFNFYDIEENARESAESMLVEARKNANANGEWDDEDAYIFWGEVSQAPFEIKGAQVNDYGDCETEFELRDVVAKAI